MPKKQRRKATVLIPLNFNDGSRVPKKVLAKILDDLYISFDGWTIEGEVTGAYRMKSNKKCVEKLVRVAVVVHEDDVSALREQIAVWGDLLGQEMMYFELGGTVKFVPPKKRD